MTGADRSDRERSAAKSAALRSRHQQRLDPATAVDSLGGWSAVLDEWPPLVTHGLVTLLLIAVAAAHEAAPADLEFSLFYLVPVALAAWRLGRTAAVTWSVVTTAVWLVVARAGWDPASPFLTVWSVLAVLGILVSVAIMLTALRSLLERLGTLAGTDHLTGVLNGGSFEELVELERNRALRYNRPFTLAYLDVDGFRVVNDVRGHSTGDRALELIAQTTRENLRSMDSVARLGGDEFAILLPETGRGAAEVALEKIRTCLNEAVSARSLPLTFSIGAVICVGAPESVDRLIQRSDALMQSVKQNGGDGLALEVLDDPFGIEAILQRG